MDELKLTDKGPWGVYDTKDKYWVGNKSGPFSYMDQELARAAATIVNERFKVHVRFRAFDLPPDINKYVDELKPKITALRAIKRIESRV